MSKINHFWFKENYYVKYGTGVHYDPENVHELLLEAGRRVMYD